MELTKEKLELYRSYVNDSYDGEEDFLEYIERTDGELGFMLVNYLFSCGPYNKKKTA